MIGTNEKCLDPWMGFLIILGVCIVILVGIFNEFRGSTHHTRIHAKPNALAQAAFLNAKPDAQAQPGEITFQIVGANLVSTRLKVKL